MLRYTCSSHGWSERRERPTELSAPAFLWRKLPRSGIDPNRRGCDQASDETNALVGGDSRYFGPIRGVLSQARSVGWSTLSAMMSVRRGQVPKHTGTSPGTGGPRHRRQTKCGASCMHRSHCSHHRRIQPAAWIDSAAGRTELRVEYTVTTSSQTFTGAFEAAIGDTHRGLVAYCGNSACRAGDVAGHALWACARRHVPSPSTRADEPDRPDMDVGSVGACSEGAERAGISVGSVIEHGFNGSCARASSAGSLHIRSRHPWQQRP